MVFFTGDLAFAGQADEYETAHKGFLGPVLEACNLTVCSWNAKAAGGSALCMLSDTRFASTSTPWLRSLHAGSSGIRARVRATKKIVPRDETFRPLASLPNVDACELRSL